MTPQGLDAQRGCTQLVTQQEYSVIAQTDLEINKTDVEPVFGCKSSRTSPRKTRWGGAYEGSSRTSKVS
jgi:hypothetical protein